MSLYGLIYGFFLCYRYFWGVSGFFGVVTVWLRIEFMVKDSVIERVTQELLERYETRAQLETRLPERDRIICLIESMSLLLFPGYYTSNSTRQYTEKYALSAGLSTLQKDLASVLESERFLTQAH